MLPGKAETVILNKRNRLQLFYLKLVNFIRRLHCHIFHCPVNAVEVRHQRQHTEKYGLPDSVDVSGIVFQSRQYMEHISLCNNMPFIFIAKKIFDFRIKRANQIRECRI